MARLPTKQDGKPFEFDEVLQRLLRKPPPASLVKAPKKRRMTKAKNGAAGN